MDKFLPTTTLCTAYKGTLDIPDIYNPYKVILLNQNLELKKYFNYLEFLYNPVHASQHLSIDLLLYRLGQYKGKTDRLFVA
jgi:hypothetical protein